MKQRRPKPSTATVTDLRTWRRQHQHKLPPRLCLPGLCRVYRFAESGSRARELREFERAFNVCADPEIVFHGAGD